MHKTHGITPTLKLIIKKNVVHTHTHTQCCMPFNAYVVLAPRPDPEVGRDVLQLVQCLRLVSDSVSGDMAYEMEKALDQLQSPERAAELVLENMLANDRSVH